MAVLGVIFSFLVCQLVQTATAEYGILKAQPRDLSTYQYYCLRYDPQWEALPTDPDEAVPDPLLDMTPLYGCEDYKSPGRVPNHVVAIKRGNCTFFQKARTAQKYGADAILVISEDKLVDPGGNTSEYKEIHIPVALLSHEDFLHMQSLGSDLEVSMYSPPEPLMEYNLIVIWLMAVFTVGVGGYWAGAAKGKKKRKKHRQYTAEDGERDGDGEDEEEVPPEEDQEQLIETVEISPKFIAIFVFMICALLLLLYFFYNYLVYVIIFIFCFASATGLYVCLLPLVLWLPGNCRLPENKLPLLKKRPRVKTILLAVCCLSVSLVWFIFRKERWAWILQDGLGIAFSIYMLKTIRLPSFMVCTILLAALFVYDIFFVFITPLLTKSQTSVMVDVARGPEDATEQIPMVLKVPSLRHSGSAMCNPYSLLGFGDILVPGLLIAFCKYFDSKIGSWGIYYLATLVAYGVGMIITFFALVFMKNAQPALLYLVPCTLLTATFVACRRGEIKQFWRGTTVSLRMRYKKEGVLLEDQDEDDKLRQDEEQGETREGEREDLTSGEEGAVGGDTETTPKTTDQNDPDAILPYAGSPLQEQRSPTRSALARNPRSPSSKHVTIQT
ncbi:SPPL2A [Branchiostoma lanceolatum]|uniref:SPPL2A protein n=1 Tax=Branchiostoma lanceolatum TaxID=7740 RepID=A0A8J9ZDH3_BRALA|nr:SPPL2A [Branchiostoma lanceolatum]